MQAGGTDLNRLRRAAIWAPFFKAIPCAALGGYSMWLLTTPIYGFGWTLTFVVAVLWLIFGAGYFLAAFLLSRRSFLWRLSGGVNYAAAPGLGGLGIFLFPCHSPGRVRPF